MNTSRKPPGATSAGHRRGRYATSPRQRAVRDGRVVSHVLVHDHAITRSNAEKPSGTTPRDFPAGSRFVLCVLTRDPPITMLASMHDMRLVRELFPRTIVLDEGMIVADGLMREILENEKLLEVHGLERV